MKQGAIDQPQQIRSAATAAFSLGEIAKLQRDEEGYWCWTSPSISVRRVATCVTDEGSIDLEVRFALRGLTDDRRYITDVMEVVTNSLYRALRLSGFNNPKVLSAIKQNGELLFRNWARIELDDDGGARIQQEVLGRLISVPFTDYVPMKVLRETRCPWYKSLTTTHSGTKARMWFWESSSLIAVVSDVEEDRGVIVEIHYAFRPDTPAALKFAVITGMRHSVWTAEWLRARRLRHNTLSTPCSADEGVPFEMFFKEVDKNETKYNINELPL